MWKALLVAAFFFIAKGDAKDCIPRKFDSDSIVCVCNATYCDDAHAADPNDLQNGDLYWYATSKDGLRMKMSRAKFGTCSNTSTTNLIIDSTKRYQTILGFGGAFTDAAGINIAKLSPTTQDQLLRAYYGSGIFGGSGYTLGRVPIGGTDFSTRPYTLADVAGDTELKHFALAEEDLKYKIPYMQKALELNPEMKFFSAAWSAPAWMKTNNKINKHGFLKNEYYQLYANYIVKFLEEYKKKGFDIWAFSTGNEPLNAYVPFDVINSMGWTPTSVAQWVAEYMGPTLAASKYNETLIMTFDDNRILLPWWVKKVFTNQKAKNYISGTALHWYLDGIISWNVVDQIHNAFPDKFILMTEACTGSNILDSHKVALGSWDRGVQYITSIIQYMNHWAIGWVDWNLALDKQGGPNWIKNFVDSPIIVNPESDEFYKQPMYYAIQHFSKFVVRGSVRISITNDYSVNTAAFVTPSNYIVVVLNNRSNQPKNVNLQDLKRGASCLELPANSMNTIVYKM